MTNPLEQEVARRRTFAIISHPDAGKTTLTEKILLFGGAVSLDPRFDPKMAEEMAGGGDLQTLVHSIPARFERFEVVAICILLDRGERAATLQDLDGLFLSRVENVISSEASDEGFDCRFLVPDLLIVSSTINLPLSPGREKRSSLLQIR